MWQKEAYKVQKEILERIHKKWGQNISKMGYFRFLTAELPQVYRYEASVVTAFVYFESEQIVIYVPITPTDHFLKTIFTVGLKNVNFPKKLRDAIMDFLNVSNENQR